MPTRYRVWVRRRSCGWGVWAGTKYSFTTWAKAAAWLADWIAVNEANATNEDERFGGVVLPEGEWTAVDRWLMGGGK